MKNFIKLPMLSCWFAVLAHTNLSAEQDQSLEMGAPFADRAILQRGMPVPVWGWANKGNTVTIQFSGQSKTVKVDEEGKWRVSLDPLQASSTGRAMLVKSSDGSTKEIKDLLVGEVWMASGQSNMQWIAEKCDVGRVLQARIAKRVEAGEEQQPIIREAKVLNYFAALHPIEHAEVKWENAGKSTSAIAYAFAYELHRELGVPVGILNCSFSQTAIQAWTPRQGFRDGEDDETRNIYKKLLESDPNTAEHKAAWNNFYANNEKILKQNKERAAVGQKALAVDTNTPGNLASNRDATWLFNARTNPMIPFAIRGAIWNQGYANTNEGLSYYNNLHNMIRGWREVWKRPDLPVYFHQFYCPKVKGERKHFPKIGQAADMRMGTWLARDIPNTGMASQIDISGSIHYFNKALPGQRLALHALKNQYGKDIVANGPMFKSYQVKGSTVTVELEYAQGGLLVAETGTNSKSNLALPQVIPDGIDQVSCFYLAGVDRVWHPARAQIDGQRLLVTSKSVKNPVGISYGTRGIGNTPNIYNKALLPLTPFIYFDQKLVTAKSWSKEGLNIVGMEPDPSTQGLSYVYRKMPLLSTQFRENAVLQADVPVTIWGSALHDWGYEAEQKAEINFSFAGIKKVIPVTPGMREWKVVLPPMQASEKPKTLKVSYSQNGELVHQRIVKGIIMGDVYYVAAPHFAKEIEISKVRSSAPVRALYNQAKRSTKDRPSRFSVAVSTTPLNRFASYWTEPKGLAHLIGHQIGAKSGRPVGIILMQSKKTKKENKTVVDLTPIKSWIPAEDLNKVPEFSGDYENLAMARPGNSFYDENVKKYLQAWKDYWGQYIPKLMATKKVPDEVAWGTFPKLSANINSEASQSYNVMVHSFTPLAVKGIVFISSPIMADSEGGSNLGASISALANSWRQKMESPNAKFYFTIPSKGLAPLIQPATQIKGDSAYVEVADWNNQGYLSKLVEQIVQDSGR